jgi:peptidoglycan/xylan/chitin deacetylase (PgdA/CDA1 family)
VAGCLLAIVVIVLVLAGCGSTAKTEPTVVGRPGPADPPGPFTAPESGPGRSAPLPEVPPEAFESKDFVVTLAKPGDTAETLAARYLGDPAKAWMVEDYGQVRTIVTGQEVVIPKQEWNPPGVYPDGYQLVPILVYHDIRAQSQGRLRIAASTFEEQMRYLKAEGYRPIRLEDFIAHLLDRRQLPRKSVLLTFDDGHKGFLQYAHPVLKELGFPAALFIQSDQISVRPNSGFLSWPELRDLVKDGVEIQPHSKTHGDLRRTSGESESAYARRMQAELGHPLTVLRTQLPRADKAPESVAYPFGEWDENLLRYVKQHGYAVGFTVRREANAAFVPLLKVNRSQVFADWTLDEFKKNLNTFQPESLLVATAPIALAPAAAPPSAARSRRQLLAALHITKSEELESRGWLRQALEQSKIALTIDPADAATQKRRDRLEDRIESEVATRMQQGLTVARSSPSEARRSFLAALALNPTSQEAFEALRTDAPPPRFITHIVRSNDTTASVADLYYGDPSRSEIIEQANGLRPGAPLSVGRSIKIPEVPGVPLLRPDR